MLLTNGAAIHHDPVSGQGTVGAWLIHAPSGMRFGLGCSHVLAALGHAQVGSPVYQQQHVAGHLHAHIALYMDRYNNADAAIFAVPPQAMLQWAHTPPTGTAQPQAGMAVYKHGVTTGYTEGRIVHTALDRRLRLRGVGLWFQGILAIEGVGRPFSDHGDSGALVMEVGTNRTVGVLLAMNEEFAFAYPMAAAAPLLRDLHFAL